MRFRWLGPLLLLSSIAVASPPPPAQAPAPAPPRVAAKPATSKLAPASIPHPTAMLLANWSQDGKRQVSFKAAAIGTRFLLEDTSGVTVYRFDGSGYVGETFLRGASLSSAKKRLRLK